MSHWDFSRRPGAGRDAAPAGPSDTAYQPDMMLGAPGAWDAPDAYETYETGPGDGGWPAGGGAQAEDPWPRSWTDGDGWPAEADVSPGDGWPPADSGEADEETDEETGPYPLTYERDDFTGEHGDFTEAGAGQVPPPAAPWEPWPAAPGPLPPRLPRPAAPADDTRTMDDADEEDDGEPQPDGWEGGFAGPGGWDSAVRQTRRGGLRWPVVAGVVAAGAAVGAAAVLLTGHAPASRETAGASAGAGAGTRAARSAAPATRASATRPAPATATPAAAAPLTLAQAQAVVAGYTTANNQANAQRSGTLLATIETGSSYAIDAGLYQAQQGTAPYPAFAPAQAAYYIPRGEAASGPRWFAVQVANAFDANPGKVTSTEYLLFTQTAPGGPWQDAVEPYLLPGASVPKIAVGPDGLATAVAPDAASVTVPPGQLAAATAASADGTAAGSGQAAITVPGNLADVSDKNFWQGKLPDATVTDTHAPASGTAGQEFALQTADGGALVFYTDAAQLTLTPPPGGTLSLTIPGFYSAGQALSRAGVTYLEQFAAYDPPAGGTAPTVVADYSGITGKD
jgi:hypothetical protein